MRRSGLALGLLVLAGCRSILGFESTSRVDAGDPVPSIGFEVTMSGGDEQAGTLAIRVALSEPAATPVSVDYAVTGGTATASADFTIGGSSLVFDPGQTTATIPVTIISDTDESEPDETIELALSNPTGATLGNATHTITIANHLLPRVQFDVAASQTDETTQSMLTVTLDKPAEGESTVQLALTGTATTGSDYTLANLTTVTIPDGATSVTVPIGEVDDALDEDDETLVVMLVDPSPNLVVGATASTTHTIIDNDASPIINFALASSTTNEGAGTVQLVVALTAPSGRIVTVDYGLDAASTATAADATIAGTTLVFQPGETQHSILVDIVQDNLDENNEQLVVKLANPVHTTIGVVPQHTLTILDDDNPPTVSFDPNETDRSAVELDLGDTAYKFTIVLSAPSGKSITVDFNINGTASLGSDFTVQSMSPIVFDPGDTMKSLDYSVRGDTLHEQNETINFNLGGTTNATKGGVTTRRHTIVNDD